MWTFVIVFPLLLGQPVTVTITTTSAIHSSAGHEHNPIPLDRKV